MRLALDRITKSNSTCARLGGSRFCVKAVIGVQYRPHIARLVAVFGGEVGGNIDLLPPDLSGHLALAIFKFFRLGKQPVDLRVMGDYQGIRGMLPV